MAEALCFWSTTARMSLAMPPPIQSPFREEDSDSDASEDSAGLKQKPDLHKSTPIWPNVRGWEEILGWPPAHQPLSALIVGMKHLTQLAQRLSLPTNNFPMQRCKSFEKQPMCFLFFFGEIELSTKESSLKSTKGVKILHCR